MPSTLRAHGTALSRVLLLGVRVCIWKLHWRMLERQPSTALSSTSHLGDLGARWK